MANVHQFEVIVVGAGAAGLFAAIHAGRAGARVLALDGAKTLGAKILVAGGGRCNVTHHAVDEKAYAGSSPNAIKNVLRRFDGENHRIPILLPATDRPDAIDVPGDQMPANAFAQLHGPLQIHGRA